MDDLTVTEWLKEEKLIEEEIEFLLTFITYISVLKSQPAKAIIICQSINKQFPKVNLPPEENYLDYNVFKFTVQKYTTSKISVRELLIRMSEQKICKPLCDFFLQS